MKLHLLIKIIFVLLVSMFLVQVCIAQEPKAEEQTQNQTVEDSDRLPFMQKENPAEYSEPGTGTLLVKTFGAMLLIVGLIFAGAWVLKKFGYGGVKIDASEDTPELAVLSKVPTGNGQTLSIVKFGERTLLIGSTAQSFTLLAEQGEFETKNTPRSVAEMLAEENISFEKEFENAREILAISAENGGQV